MFSSFKTSYFLFPADMKTCLNVPKTKKKRKNRKILQTLRMLALLIRTQNPIISRILVRKRNLRIPQHRRKTVRRRNESMFVILSLFVFFYLFFISFLKLGLNNNINISGEMEIERVKERANVVSYAFLVRFGGEQRVI